MSNLLLKRLLLLSVKEKRARAIDFHPRTTVITGDNDTGKSSILKSILRCFGTEPPVHADWDRAAVSLLLTFSKGEATYSILRQGTLFTVFDKNGEAISQFNSVTKGLGPFLAGLF